MYDYWHLQYNVAWQGQGKFRLSEKFSQICMFQLAMIKYEEAI